ncbi:MAG: respiratory nitrate reductase subunit gamma [Proteobacteria bacterium]|nr:respiratory nitrate reductase subunit gamma [Pseudomonadota bacterium]
MEGRSALKPKLHIIRGLAALLLVLAWCGMAEAREAWLIDGPKFHASVHGRTACTDCHEDAASDTGHPNPARPGAGPFKPERCEACHDKVSADLAQGVHAGARTQAGANYTDCLSCHEPHYQQVPRQPARTRCDACHEMRTALPPSGKSDRDCVNCHLAGVAPFPARSGGLIPRPLDRAAFEPGRVHYLDPEPDPSFCRLCHRQGNRIGAATRVLPEKGLLCLPCHVASFSVNDTVSIVALILFFAGLVGLASVWLSGRLEGGPSGAPGKLATLAMRVAGVVFSARLLLVFQALVLDVLLQRRLWRQSRGRWIIHGLIFFPLVVRCLWGLGAMIMSAWWPESPSTWTLLDPDAPLTSVLFDLTGLMILLGAFLALARRLAGGPSVPGLPPPDWPGLALLAGMVLSGFLVEGWRMAMTGAVDGRGFAFIGRLIGQALSGHQGLADAYGWLWYAHAILVAAFAAYLPFSRLVHMFLAPLVMIVNRVLQQGGE